MLHVQEKRKKPIDDISLSIGKKPSMLCTHTYWINPQQIVKKNNTYRNYFNNIIRNFICTITKSDESIGIIFILLFFFESDMEINVVSGSITRSHAKSTS